MKYCKTCDIHYDTTVDHCIFCNSELKSEPNKVYEYNYRPYIKHKTHGLFIYKLFLLLNIISVIICTYLDYIKDSHLYWSLIVSVGHVYAMILYSFLYYKIHWLTRIIWIIIATTLSVLGIAYITNDTSWAIDYILPFSIITNILISKILVLSRMKRFFDYLMHLFIVSLIGVVPLLLNIFNVTTTRWPSTVAFLYSIIVLITIFVLTSKETKEEFKRRFHI